MKLDSRQFRFTVPFATFSARRLVKLGGKRGSLHLQETALVAEGELLRFTFIIGLEWLFRRALSEWTMVTVPYSRIQAVRISKLWPLRSSLRALCRWLDRPHRLLVDQRRRAPHHGARFRRHTVAGLREPACPKIDSCRILAQGSTSSARLSDSAASATGIVFEIAS